MKTFYFTFFFLSVYSVFSQTTELSGTVYIDANENDILDALDEPLPGVMISDGQQILTTDKNGAYKITIDQNSPIFPILPSGYNFKHQNWWYQKDVQNDNKPGTGQQINFSLQPTSEIQNFKALIIGDIQVGDYQELEYAEKSILSELQKRDDYAFSLFMGDLVNDEPELFLPLKTQIFNLDKPAWMVYGNHDRNSEYEHENQHKDFSKYFGPRTYAFFKNDILFIVLNTIEPVGKYGYQGKYPKSDLNFLNSLLKQVDSETLLVINQHVPLGMVKNKNDFLDIVKNHSNILMLSGHTHTVHQNFRNDIGKHFHEVTVGGVSGHWWTGEKDWKGIPLALMQCGTPRGYFEIDFTTKEEITDYKIRYKGVGLSPDQQMSLWLGDPEKEITRTLSKENYEIYANIYSGSNHSEVKMRIDEGEWQPMKKFRMIDPFVNRIKSLQKENLYPNKISKKSPYLSRASSHIWQGYAPKNLTKGLHRLEVSVKNKNGITHSETTWFWFE